MEKKFNFIQLPKSEVVLTGEEQSYLLGGGNCDPYTSCPKDHNNTCTFYSGHCSNTGSCGGQFYCASHTCVNYDFTKG